MHRYVTEAIAYSLAIVLLWFAASKIFALQFMVPAHVLATPVNELRGQELMWVFFGWSKTYERLIGCVELVGALLVMMPATRFVGALMLVPVLANILVLDIVFGVRAVLVASVLLGLALTLVIHEWRRLRALFETRVSCRRLVANALVVLVVFSTMLPLMLQRK